MLDQIIRLIFCHLLGDYVLQTPFLAETKGRNRYHMFVHCALCLVLPSILFLFWARMAVGIFVLFPFMHRHSESQIPENQLYLRSGTALLYAAYLPDFSITWIFKIRKNI